MVILFQRPLSSLTYKHTHRQIISSNYCYIISICVYITRKNEINRNVGMNTQNKTTSQIFKQFYCCRKNVFDEKKSVEFMNKCYKILENLSIHKSSRIFGNKFLIFVVNIIQTNGSSEHRTLKA